MARKNKRGVADVARYSGSGGLPPSFNSEPEDDTLTSGTVFFLTTFVLFLGIVVAAVVFGTQNIEENLTARATANLQAAGFSDVSVEAQGSTLIISGSMSPDQTETEAISAVQAVSGVGSVEGTLWPVFDGELQTIEISESAMQIDWNAGTVEVVGTVATIERRDFVIASLSSTFSSVLADDLLVVEGLVEEPRWLGDSLGLLMSVQAKLPAGKLIVDPSGKLLVVAGETEDKDLKAELNASIVVVADDLGYDVNPAIRLLVVGPTVEQIEELQVDLDAVLADKVVEFETKSSDLTAAGTQLLDELLIQLRLAPEIRIQIAGHTDSKGSAEANLALSADRAESVLQYFIDNGETPDRFVVVAYGEEQPTADNNTADGRARNRRIEFTALEGTA